MKVQTDFEADAKRVLGLLLEDVASCDPSGAPVLDFEPGTCANCGAARPPRSPYCSDACRQVAGFVRQMRQALAAGALDGDEEKRVHKGEVFWRLLGGGLPRREANIPERSRLAVLKAQEYRCQVCGGEADRIENTGTG